MTASTTITAADITIAAVVLKVCSERGVEVTFCSGVTHSVIFSRGYIIQDSSKNSFIVKYQLHTTLHEVFLNIDTNFTIVNLDIVTVSSELREEVFTATVFTWYITDNSDIIALSARHI